ncbi:TonB-dependent receptor domain-containing protein [Wenyingzhuangia sp. IMCC45574]
MKRFFLLFIFIGQFAFAQQAQKSITGTIVNKKTNETIPFVTIFIKNPKETKTSLADEEGNFLTKGLTKKNYSIVVEAIGYKPFQKKIVLSDKNTLNIGKIELEQDIHALEAVELRAETTSIEQKIDRVVIKVGKDLTSVGTDAASVLDNVQSVTVDQQTGELSLRGNSNVRVLIDGKPTNIPTEQLIKQLPANAIKNIELITNPSAKYSPEGNSGIINIELVKNSRKGFNGSVNGSLTHGRNYRGNAGTNFNYKVKNLNFYGNYSYRGGDDDIKGKIERHGVSRQDNYGINQRNNHFLKLGSDIDLDDKTSISLFTVQTFNKLNYTNSSLITDLTDNKFLNDNVFSLERKPRSQNYDASFHKKFDDKKHTLDFGIAFNTSESPETSDWSDTVETSKQSNFTEDIEATSKRWIVNLDYAKPINEDISIETGLDFRNWINKKSNFSDQIVNDKLDNPVSRNSTRFDFDRKIYAGYFNYRQQIGDLGLQAGVRAEYYDLFANFNAYVDDLDKDAVDDKFSIYPSFFATYKVTEKDQVQFSYSRRVDRPSVRQLNPIRTWGTPLVISKGNPDLTQQFTNSFELRYNRKVKGGNVSLTGFYRKLNDFISRSLDVDEQVDGRTLLSYDNFDKTDNYGFELASYLKIRKWWNLNGSIDIYYRDQQGVVAKIQEDGSVIRELVSVDNYLFNFRLNNKFTIGKKFSFQMTQMYRGKDKNVQFERKTMFMMNLGASYKVLNDKGTITLGASDIFNVFRAKFNIVNPYPQQGQFNWESQNVTLGFNYNFGNQFKQKRRSKRPGHEEGGGGGVF